MLRDVTLLVGVLATGTILLGSLAQYLGWAMVVVLVGAPIARVLALAIRWWAEGDVMFTTLAALLLLALVSGAAAALILRA